MLIARLSKDTHMIFQRRKINNEAWLPVVSHNPIKALESSKACCLQMECNCVWQAHSAINKESTQPYAILEKEAS
jgi:hypothetical protein